jgi:hypothetical protein
MNKKRLRKSYSLRIYLLDPKVRLFWTVFRSHSEALVEEEDDDDVDEEIDEVSTDGEEVDSDGDLDEETKPSAKSLNSSYKHFGPRVKPLCYDRYMIKDEIEFRNENYDLNKFERYNQYFLVELHLVYGVNFLGPDSCLALPKFIHRSLRQGILKGEVSLYH